jgi:hypothetical protein
LAVRGPTIYKEDGDDVKMFGIEELCQTLGKPYNWIKCSYIAVKILGGLQVAQNKTIQMYNLQV